MEIEVWRDGKESTRTREKVYEERVRWEKRSDHNSRLIKRFYSSSNKKAGEATNPSQVPTWFEWPSDGGNRGCWSLHRITSLYGQHTESWQYLEPALLSSGAPSWPCTEGMWSVTGLQSDIYSNGGYDSKPAFMQTLKDHLLSRLLDLDYDGDERTFTLDKRNNVHLINFDAIVELKILCINYTTYDICWDHNTIRTTCGDVVMTSLRDEAHPFWYARVLCAFHIQVHFRPGGVSHSKQSMEVLWIHWLGIDQDHKWSFRDTHLLKVGFVPDDTDHIPFGFLDPSLMICGCHLIPAFIDGHTHNLLQRGPSLVRLPGELDDWAAFYVNMWACPLNFLLIRF